MVVVANVFLLAGGDKGAHALAGTESSKLAQEPELHSAPGRAYAGRFPPM